MTATATFTVTTVQVRIGPPRPMGYLDEDTAKRIVCMMHREVPFVLGAGARCPLCGTYAGTKSGAKNGVRYHFCAECGHNFRSILSK